MDDFLHNLRSGKLKQADRGKRDFTDYKGTQRRAGNERRRTDYYAKVTNENFSLIKETLDLLAESQKRIADAAEARVKSDARIADSLEAIAVMMGRRWEYTDILPHRSEPTDAKAYGPEADDIAAEATEEKDAPYIGSGDDKRMNSGKPSLRDIIEAMRTDGDSWEKIARHFDDQKIPTISGKGKWRGPAIKKFWDTNTEATVG